MSPRRALVPNRRACLPAVHDTFSIDGAVAAGAASIRRTGRTRAKAGHQQRHSHYRSHVVTPLKHADCFFPLTSCGREGSVDRLGPAVTF